ncbi:hypothetical protein LTR66_012259 [Elasticomyces elasticus]|nr:hypothetical protein LTR66_012259 [Elasticomyces elasticus]KAK4983733.1 hypothetical protein LTR50_007052 [Elasticomyces elasticus]
MSDDEADPELLEMLRKSLGISSGEDGLARTTGVLEDAEYIYNNSIDVAIDMRGTQAAASLVHSQMLERGYSTQTWSEHELHPKSKDERTVNFIFTVDLLNFSFWSEISGDERFCVEYRGRRWTGYWSLVAALQRALDEDIPITTPSFWIDSKDLTQARLRHIFRSATDGQIPLLVERLDCLQEAGRVLEANYDSSILSLIESANKTAGSLVNLLARDFPCFRDEHRFEGKKVRFLKRAQIFVADLWAAFNGEGYGEFMDIHELTMFADYRVPQILHTLGVLIYSPPLENHIRALRLIEPGDSREVQLRGCSIWAVELLRREILKRCSDMGVNSVLIDFFLYDLAKEREKEGMEAVPHHRTRSIWY